MSTLDDIRADIVKRRDEAQAEIDSFMRIRDMADAALAAHDRAVATMDNGAEAAMERAERRDIAALVYDDLKLDEPRAVSQIAESIKVAPSRVAHVLKGALAARVSVNEDGFRRSDG